MAFQRWTHGGAASGADRSSRYYVIPGEIVCGNVSDFSHSPYFSGH